MAPEARGQGAADALIRACADRARELGAPVLSWHDGDRQPPRPGRVRARRRHRRHLARVRARPGVTGTALARRWWSGAGGIRTPGPLRTGCFQGSCNKPDSATAPGLAGPGERSRHGGGRLLERRLSSDGARVAKLDRRPALLAGAWSSGRVPSRGWSARSAGRRSDGLTVHAAGSGHSFTEAALTDGAMIRIEALNRVLDADPASGLVKVEAGITLRDLNAALWERGLAMENLGDIDRQTLAGAISTATHGTGAELRNLSAQVEALELVLADGSVLEVSEQADADAYRAARVGLGALGVIYSVTLRAVPAFTLHRVDSPRPLEETLASLDELAARNDHFEFFVFPYTDTALTIERNRTDGPPRPRGPRQRLPERDRARELRHGRAALERRAPRSRRRSRGWSASPPRQFSRTERTDRSYRIFASERRVRFTEMEYAIPRAARPGGGAPGAEPGARARAPGRLPDRVPAGRPRRRAAQPRPRAPDRLRRGPPVPGGGLGALLPGRRADHVRVRGPPALGQAPLPDRRDAGAALPALGRLPRGPRPARPRGPLLERLYRTACSARFVA